MTGATTAIKTLIIAAAVTSSMTLPAYSQHFTKGSGGREGPPVENKPKVDEKTYKAALDRIPESDKKYDPWGIARPAEAPKAAKKAD